MDKVTSHKYWVIKANGNFWIDTLAHSRKNAVDLFVSDANGLFQVYKTWRQWYKKGARAVKVSIQELH